MDYELMLGNALILLNEVETRGVNSVQNLHNAFQILQKMRDDVRMRKETQKEGTRGDHNA